MSRSVTLLLAGCLLLGAQAAEPVRVNLVIRTETGKPTGLRLRVTDAGGAYFAPVGHTAVADPKQHQIHDDIFGDGKETPFALYALVYDGAELDLPPGRYTFAATKGYEYDAIHKQVEIAAGQRQTVTLPLRQFADFEAKGWYPGDTHVHMPDVQAVRYQMECEGLRVVNMVLGGSRTPLQGAMRVFWYPELFTGAPAADSDTDHFIQIGEELGHRLLAHMGFLKLKSIVWDPQNRAEDVSDKLALYADDDAHAQGGLVIWFHWPYPSLEAPLDMALGRVDAVDLITTGSPLEAHASLLKTYEMNGPSIFSKPPIEVYYHYLNCGFHLAVASGSDKPWMSPPMGSARAYVKVEGPLSYASWVEGIRKGRSFATDYPLLEFSVDGKESGETLRLRPGKAKLRVKARAVSLEPYEALEIVYDGKVVRSAKPAGKRFEAAIDETIEVDRGGWIAARAHGHRMLDYGPTFWRLPVFAHTSPIYLDMPGRPAPAAAGARLFLEQLDYLQKWAETRAKTSESEKQKALALIAQAREVYRKLIER